MTACSGCARLRVHAPEHGLGPELGERSSEALHDCCLSGAGWPDEHNTVADEVGFIELDALVEPRLVRLQPALSHHLCSKQNGEEFMSA